MTINLAARAAIVNATIKPFRERSFDWASDATCIHLARALAVGMGYSVPVIPGFKTPLGARRALGKMGCSTIPQLLDTWFERWDAPARALIGDLAVLPGDTEGLEAIVVSDGAGNWLGWHAANLSRMSRIAGAHGAAIAAWRL